MPDLIKRKDLATDEDDELFDLKTLENNEELLAKLDAEEDRCRD